MNLKFSSASHNPPAATISLTLGDSQRGAGIFVIRRGHSWDSDQIPKGSTPTQPIQKNWFWFSKKATKSPRSSLYSSGQEKNYLILSNRRIKGRWWHSCIFSLFPLSYQSTTCFLVFPLLIICGTRQYIIQWHLC